MRRETVRFVAGFVLVNVVLGLVLWVVLFAPVAARLGRTEDIIRMQEGRLRIHEAQVVAYAENVAVAAALWDAIPFVPADRLGAALADIIQDAVALGLGVEMLSAAEPMFLDAFVEKRVLAVFRGDWAAVEFFTQLLKETGAAVQTLYVEFADDGVVLRVNFSLFGL